MPPVFVDTSIWYAAADDGDAHNEVARSLLSEHAGELVTSDLVLAELWNLINARAGHHTANRVVTAIAAGIARVECAVSADLQAAAAASAAFPDQAFSLTDRTSWVLMERLGITDALALDADFRIYRYGPERRQAFIVKP
ncbi:MAG: PIN domain-containing protein [Acidimicrobiia bacterium]|nr:PIN domain-containing protein [Acidimicrobiia bacterium]MYC44050.1 PIN domain-containing protein [Acidimicrobiia bacterium]MYI19233.1 PIN domain-containing protein [Acidimicrobiia bacterium]